jgi:hypothetical protein
MRDAIIDFSELQPEPSKDQFARASIAGQQIGPTHDSFNQVSTL